MGLLGETEYLIPYVARWQEQHSIRSSCELHGVVSLPRGTEETLYHVTRAATATVARHRGANVAQLVLRQEATIT